MLLLISGLPGSGKSYFAKAFSAKLGASHINSDQVRQGMGKTGKYSVEDKWAVYRTMEKMAERELSKGRTVVVDATFYLKETREGFSRMAQNNGVKVFMVEVVAQEKLVRERLSKSRPDSEADYQVYKEIKSQFQLFDEPHLKLESTNDNLEEMISQAEAYIFER